MRQFLKVRARVALVALVTVTAVLLMGAGTAACADVASRSLVLDSQGRPSFVPQIQFWGAAKDGVQIGMGFSKRDLHYKVGEPVEALLTLRNAGADQVGFGTRGPYYDYNVAVSYGFGIPVPLTHLGRQAERGGNFILLNVPSKLAPGREYTESLPVSSYHWMAAPGTYAITATRCIGGVTHAVGPITIVVGNVREVAIVRALGLLLVLGVLAAVVWYFHPRQVEVGESETAENKT